MSVLGAVLAGGASRRFGTDKALATWRGRMLLDHALTLIAPHVDKLVVCGRAWSGVTSIPDRPEQGLGPLGGLNAALHHAAAHGLDRVLTVPCDTPTLPRDMLARLVRCPYAAYLEQLPVVGCWPASLAAALDQHLSTADDRSMRRWAAVAGAKPVAGGPIPNVNRPEDLRALPPCPPQPAS